MPLEPIPIEVEPQPFELRLEVFSGPLDLLLQLIESRQLDVLTVPLAEMADAYVEHLANHPVPADELADFVAIASQLILLKSRRLLPGDPPSALTPPPGCHLHPRCAHAQDVCRRSRPELVAAAGHSTACHLWRDIVSSGPPVSAAAPEFPPGLQRLFRAFDAGVER